MDPVVAGLFRVAAKDIDMGGYMVPKVRQSSGFRQHHVVNGVDAQDIEGAVTADTLALAVPART